MLDPVKVIDTQCSVIRMQSDIINELFTLLMQHITAEEADALPVVQKINTVAAIRQEIE